MTNKYKIIVDMYETKSESRREWEFEAPMMSSLKGVGDELIITYGELKLRKRVGITKYNNYYLMQDPVETMLELTAVKNPVKNFEDTVVLFNGVNYISVEGVNGEIFLKYIVNSPFTDGLMTKTDLRSEIRVLEQEISMKVSKNDIISEINLTPGTARISADKIALEGYTTINDGFSIDEVGNMTCNNATINGGLVVKDGLYACLVFRPSEGLAEILSDYSGLASLRAVGYYSHPGILTQNPLTVGFPRLPLMIHYSIPADFEIVNAKVKVEHQSVNWVDVYFGAPGNGINKTFNNAKVKDIEAYIGEMHETSTSVNFHYNAGAGSRSMEDYMTTKINNIWGSGVHEYNFANGYNTKWTEDISSYINLYQDGVISFAPIIKSYPQLPNAHEYDPSEDGMKSTAFMNATLYVYGYLKMVGND